MHDPDPSTRITVEEELNDAWLANVDSLINEEEFVEVFRIIEKAEREDETTDFY